MSDRGIRCNPFFGRCAGEVRDGRGEGVIGGGDGGAVPDPQKTTTADSGMDSLCPFSVK